MPKILYLVRHAKSSWSDVSLHDRERPLNRRGRKSAPDMGRRLKEQGHRPDLIISSPARRAFSTAK
jgi:phosphohistidine phosphatase